MSIIKNNRLANVRKLLLGIFVAATLLGFSSSAFAQDAWDTKISGAGRFTVLVAFAGTAVRDNETGLVWERVPSPGGFSWIQAQDHCNRLALGARGGWRLPTLQELTSIVSIGSPSGLETPNPFTPPSIGQVIWSATSSAANSTSAWGMNLPGTVSVITKPALARCWCVRFRQGVDAQ